MSEIEDEIVDEIVIEYDSTKSATSGQGRRTWALHVEYNGEAFEITLTDPFLQRQYDEVFNDYVQQSSVALWTKKLDQDSKLPKLHKQVENYRDELLTALGLRDVEGFRLIFKADSIKCKIVIHEETTVYNSNYGPSKQPLSPSIHRIHWELLEHAKLPKGLNRGKYQFQVCRMVSLKPSNPSTSTASPPGSMRTKNIYRKYLPPVKEPLETVARDTTKTKIFKILLVLARDLRPTSDSSRQNFEEHQPDIPPDAAQWPLMSIQRKLEKRDGYCRLFLDIVRPGSLEELVNHIESRKKQEPPVNFNILHFDIHGHDISILKSITNGRGVQDKKQVAGLFFAMGSESDPANSSHLEFADARDIMKKLRGFNIENVVLNSCWSACARYGRSLNLSERFLREGVKSVVGIWGRGNEVIIPQFLESFYSSLLCDGVDFETAVFNGRASLRNNRKRWPNGLTFADDFLCVQYLRGPPTLPRQQNQPLRGLKSLWARRNSLNLSCCFPDSHGRESPLLSTTKPYYKFSIITAPISGSRSPSRRPVQHRLPPDPIPLKLLFLRLEHYIMQHPFILVHNADQRSGDADQRLSKAECCMRSLANLWVKTGFVRCLKVYKAEIFKADKLDIKPEFEPQGASALLPPRTSSRTLCIIEDVDRIVFGLNQNPQVARTAKSNLEWFLNNLRVETTYIIILTGKERGDWEGQRCTGTKTPEFWSFQEDIKDRMRNLVPIRNA